MRTLTLPITKAAHKRFSLLEKNERLPMSLTPEQTSPFGFRFSGKFLCLTHDGRDVAYVSDEMTEDGKSAKVLTPLPQSDVLDAAVRRTLTRITDHLNGVSRILTREEKERKEAQAAAAARRAEEVRNAPDPLAPYRGEDTTGRVPHVTPDDMRILRDADIRHRCPFLVYERDQGVFHLGWGKNYGTLEARGTDVFFADNPNGLSGELLGAHLAETATWARRNNDPAAITEALGALPPAEFSIVSYALRPSRPKSDPELEPVNLPHGVSVVFDRGQISVVRDQSLVAKYMVPHRYTTEEVAVIPSVVNCITPNWHRNPLMEANTAGVTEEHLARFGSAWIAAMAQADPEFDAAPYAIADFEKVLADAEREDAGYGF